MADRQKILIVDDTPENIQILMEALKEDYAIVAATNGQKALQIMGKTPRPDLVLLDVMMPGIDGYEVCSRLKSEDATRNIPVIFVTALSEAGDEAEGLALGAVDYITKPINVCLVKARVQNQLELKLHRDHLEALVEARTMELLEATAAKQKLESELAVARQIQMAMLPKDLSGEKFRIAAVLEPARAVGGDLYDYFLLADGRLCFLMGDVSDKGVPAALFMAQTSALIRSMAAREDTPEAILSSVNRELARDNDACMFVTLVCGILDLTSGEVAFASGGHEPPLLVSPGRTTEFIVVPGGPALGLYEDAEFPSGRSTLKPGDMLLLYTDGVTEAFDPDGKEFSELGLLDAASSYSGFDATSLTGEIFSAVQGFAGTAEQSDDIAIMALHYRPSTDR